MLCLWQDQAMAFYEWLEEHVQIFDQCTPRRSPSCCIYHNDQIQRDTVEKLAGYLGDNTEDGFVQSSILGAACTCDDYEFSLPYDLVTLNRTNMPHEEMQLEEENLVLFYANVCNKLKGKEDAEDICNFLHELINQWYKWKDPSVTNILRVLKAITFKPYKDTFVLQISPDLWKEFFTDSLQDDVKSFDCDVCLHTDEELALKNKVYFVVQAPSFQNYLNLKTYLQRKLQEVQNHDMEMSQSTEEENSQSHETDTSQDSQDNSCDSQVYDSSNETVTQPEDMTSDPVQPSESTSSEDTPNNEEHQSTSNSASQIESNATTSESDISQTHTEPILVENSKIDANKSPTALQVTIFGNMPDIGEILAPQIPELQSPKSPPVELTLADISSGFLFHL